MNDIQVAFISMFDCYERMKKEGFQLILLLIIVFGQEPIELPFMHFKYRVERNLVSPHPCHT